MVETEYVWLFCRTAAISQDGIVVFEDLASVKMVLTAVINKCKQEVQAHCTSQAIDAFPSITHIVI